MNFVSKGLAAAVVAALVGSCNCGGSRVTLAYGRLVDSAGGTPSAPGKVTIGATTVNTNESGFFTIAVMPDTPLTLRALVPGYAPAAKNFTAPAQGTTFLQVTLLNWDSTTQFDVATGGSVGTGGTVVTFPGGALDATGQVTARLAYLDPANTGDRGAFPGGYVTMDGQMLESFGAVAVVVEDSAGRNVQLRGGQSAALQLRTVTVPTDIIPLWYFDEVAAAWKQEGQLTGCVSGTCTGSLPHLSWWNADKVYETSCLNACAKNSAGAPAVGVSLEARGVDYNGVSYGTTGADGCACLDVRKSSQVSIVGVTSGGLVGPVTHSTGATVAKCATGGCASLPSPLTVETPKFQAILTWKADPSDLDSHFTGPCAPTNTSCTNGRFHVYFSDRGRLGADPWAYLDTDDTNGFGPEITSLTQCLAGVYRFSVRLFSGSPGLEQSEAKVILLLPDGSVLERMAPTANPSSGKVWVVGDLTCGAGCACSFTPVDRIIDDSVTNLYDP